MTTVSITPETVESAVEGTAVAFTATPDVTDGVTYAWTGTNVTFDAQDTASVNATPQAEGACTVKVTVTKGDKSVSDEVSFTAGASTIAEMSEVTTNGRTSKRS